MVIERRIHPKSIGQLPCGKSILILKCLVQRNAKSQRSELLFPKNSWDSELAHLKKWINRRIKSRSLSITKSKALGTRKMGCTMRERA